MSSRFSLAVLLVTAGLAASCSNAVASMPDAYDGEPIEMAFDQAFEIELGTDRMISNDPDLYEWVIVETGVLRLVSEEDGTHPEGDDEFIGGISRYTIFTFEPASVGIGDVVFGYVPVGVENPEPVNTFVVTVSVTG